MAATIPALLTIEETAPIARVPESTVRHWIAIGRLPSVKPGKRRLIPRRALAELLGLAENELAPIEATAAA